VATFNVHCGVDGWGRPYDLEGACRLLDADVLVLQEVWTPLEGPGLAHRLGEALGYQVVTRPLVRGRLFEPSPEDAARTSWGPKAWTRARTRRALMLRARADRARVPAPTAVGASTGPGASSPAVTGAGDPPMVPRRSQHGTWDLSVLTRIPVVDVEVVDLGQLRADPARRQAVVLTVAHGGRSRRPVTVVGTHMSHLTDGSPLQYRRLARRLPADDVIVVGDMNMPGPLLQAMLPRYRRVVRGRTWPAWRPLVQSDHILATPGLAARGRGEVVHAARGSDHLPVRARFAPD